MVRSLAVLVGLLILVPNFSRAAATAGEAWTPDKLSAFFDGAKAASGSAVPVPADGAPAAPQGGVPPAGQAGQTAEGSQGASAVPAEEPRQTGAVPEGSRLNLAGPDDGSKGSASPVGTMGKAPPPLDEIAGSDWRTVGHIEDAVSDGNLSSREKQDFWDKLRNGAFWDDIGDQLCRKAKIPLKYDLNLGDVFHAKPSFERYLRTGVDGRMVLVDRAELAVGLGKGVPVLQSGSLGVSVSAGAEIRGASWVMRPLKGAKACKELDELVDFREVKTVYPLKASRFKAMQVGELWAMPLTLRATFGAGVGYPVAGVTPVTVSWGYSREGGVNVTVRRLAPDTLRVRIRIDHARVTGPAIGLDYSITGAHFYDEYKTSGQDWAEDNMGGFVGKQVFRLVERPIRRELERYLALRLQWLTQFVKEDHAVIEFVLDPNNDKQMNGLEELLSGGKFEVIDSLYQRLKVAGQAWLNLDTLKDQMPQLAETYDAALKELGSGARTFLGTERAESVIKGFRLKFPFLFDYKRNSGVRDDKITMMDDTGGEYGIYKGHRESESGFIGVPFLGQVYNYNQRRSVMTYVHTAKDGKADAAGLVFIQQAGYTSHSEDSARSLAVDAHDVMALVGTKGQGLNPRTALPLDNVFPMTPRKEEEWTSDGPPPTKDTGPVYDRGMGAFTLVLGPKAVEEILNAKPEDILRSYVVASDSWEKDAIRWALDNGKIKADGSVEYEWRKSPYYQRYRSSDDSQNDPEYAVRYALSDAKKLVRRIQEIRAMRPDGSTEPEAANRQAQALRDIMAGKGKGSLDMEYEEMLKIFVQLTEAKNVTAEFLVSAKPKAKKKPVIEGRYLLNRGMEDDASLKALAETANKFNRPSEYSD
ncbi:MAG: hypothetical protein HY924_06515 [Elusimicrobia bacterium]|nr:hypothetical protein [Elusimicrobiota bacterium]